MLELARRCEEATGSDRRLDCEVLAAVDWREPDWEPGERTVLEMVAKRGIVAFAKSAGEGLSIWRHLPRPTASVDAAMTLVPEGWCLQSLMERNATGEWNWRWSAELWNPVTDDTRKGYAKQAHANKSAPALALTAAALRARAAMGEA